MSTFKRGDKWVAKFTLHGTQLWVPGGPWQRESHARTAERRYRDRLLARPTDETCASFADRWLIEWARPETSTQRQYAAAAHRFAEHFGPTPIGDVERLSARALALTVPRSISRVIGTMYEDARNVGLVESNPFSNLRLPAAEKKGTIVPPTMEEYESLVAGCLTLGGYAAEFRAMVQFAAWTGVRQGELFALKWSDISEDMVRVHRSRKLDGSIGLPKNGIKREIPFLPPARVLDDFSGAKGSPFIFNSVRGRPLLKGTHAWSWHKVRAAAGLPGVRWHDLRHFAATQLLELGLSHFDVSIQLGHTDGGALVMARYGHPSVDAARTRLLHAFDPRPDLIGSKIGSRESA